MGDGLSPLIVSCGGPFAGHRQVNEPEALWGRLDRIMIARHVKKTKAKTKTKTKNENDNKNINIKSTHNKEIGRKF